MPCRIDISLSVRHSIEKDLAESSWGVRDAVRNKARKLNEEYKVHGAFHAWEKGNGVYQVKFRDNSLDAIVEAQYQQHLALEESFYEHLSEIVRKKKEGLSQDQKDQIELDPVTKQITIPFNEQVEFGEEEFLDPEMKVREYQEKDPGSSNKKELSKLTGSLDQALSQLYTQKFNLYFPDYKVLGTIERERFIKAVINGEIEVKCK